MYCRFQRSGTNPCSKSHVIFCNLAAVEGKSIKRLGVQNVAAVNPLNWFKDVEKYPYFTHVGPMYIRASRDIYEEMASTIATVVHHPILSKYSCICHMSCVICHKILHKQHKQIAKMRIYANYTYLRFLAKL